MTPTKKEMKKTKVCNFTLLLFIILATLMVNTHVFAQDIDNKEYKIKIKSHGIQNVENLSYKIIPCTWCAQDDCGNCDNIIEGTNFKMFIGEKMTFEVGKVKLLIYDKDKVLKKEVKLILTENRLNKIQLNEYIE
ncbi:MAG: hypothetical protein ACJASM_002716 [Salibacteraceae bacterium]|jgi:hypothetical protein